MQARFLPWMDRAGRLSALKLLVFVALFAPAIWIAVEYDLGWLAPKPDVEAIHQSGVWALRILLVSLAVSPLRRIAQWNKLIAVRRMLGVAVLFYIIGHFSLYIVQQGFDVGHVASEIVLRFYLTIGFLAFLGLSVLGATSTDAMIRRIGGGNWNRLHRVVYVIAVLALLHDMLQSKLDIGAPLLLAGLFLLLMGQRLLQRFKRGDDPVALAALALATPALTALFEAGWYAVRNGIDVTDVLGSNIDFDNPLRPAWFVLMAGVALVLVRVARPLWAKRPKAGKRLRVAAE